MQLVFRQASGCLMAALILLGLALTGLLFLRGGVWLGEQVLPWLRALSAVALALALFALLPLSLAKRWRLPAARGLGYVALMFGLTLWVMGLVLTYNAWGGVAVLVGLLLLGIGVVPMAMFASLLAADWPSLGQLLLLALLTWASRKYARQLLAQARQAQRQAYELEILEEEPPQDGAR